jgi:glutamate synthase (NADPH/NADH) small chain
MDLKPTGTQDPFGEQLPPLTPNEASIEADRCLYCYDAPCTHACPTHIDIPAFIKKIATENLRGSAETIFAANLLGATCARVCPVQELCEGACVLGSEHKPIAIGRLQRHAMDYAQAKGVHPRVTAAPTGHTVAVIGAGPAGLSCAGELAKRGHAVTLFERRALPGGLSTYGIIALREPVEVAVSEAERIAAMGVEMRTGVELGRNIQMEELQAQFDAVVLGVGLGNSPSLGIPQEEYVLDGLLYVERSKTELQSLPSGRQVIVVGAGNTAIDCATIARRAGAERVTMVYRRTRHEMSCYPHEYEFAKQEGIAFRFLTQPVQVLVQEGRVRGLQCVAMQPGAPDASGRPSPHPVPGSEFVLEADLIVKAIGQHKWSVAELLGLRTEKGFIAIQEDFETSRAGVFAIGDCIRAKGAASTVMAVQDGKLAAEAIHQRLQAGAASVAGGKHGRS